MQTRVGRVIQPLLLTPRFPLPEPLGIRGLKARKVGQGFANSEPFQHSPSKRTTPWDNGRIF